MKRIIAILLSVIMVLSLSACGGTGGGNSWQKDAASDEMKQYTKYFRFADNWDVLYEYAEYDPEAAADNPWGTGFVEFNTSEFDNMMDTLIRRFETEKENHLFAQKYLEELNKTNYYELSDLEKLIFECYAKLLFNDDYSNMSNYDFDMSKMDFTLEGFNIDMIDTLVRAYTETDDYGVQLHLYFSDNTSTADRYYFKLYDDTKNIKDQFYPGMNVSLPKDVQQELDIEEIKNLIHNNASFFEFLIEYRDSVYKEIREGEECEKAKTTTPEAFEAKIAEEDQEFEPRIGMSEDQLLNSTWGIPDRKNVDEYEWGIEEQWVYEDQGYVYLENGIVKAIQHR